MAIIKNKDGKIDSWRLLMAKRTKDSYAEIVITRDAGIEPGQLRLIATFVADGKEGVLDQDCFRIPGGDLKWRFIVRLQKSEPMTLSQLQALNKKFLQYQTTTELEMKKREFDAVRELEQMATNY